MIDLDPRKTDQEGRRRRRRKLLLRAAAFPCALLIILALLFLQPLMFNVFFSANYNNQNYGGALMDTNIQLGMNLVESYLVYYNRGVVELKSKDYAAAETDFRRSLKENPPESQLCLVRVNLALSLELQGDAAVEIKGFQKAIVSYNHAESTLRDGVCVKNESAKLSDEKALAALGRISEKRRLTVAKMNNNGETVQNEGEALANLGEDELETIRERQKKAAQLRTQARRLEASKLTGNKLMDDNAGGF